VLPGISTEQLRSRLNRMVADGMLTRKRYREVPPRVDYELTERSRQLMPILGELARWGYEWAWSAPRNIERVDIGAIFRLAPGLVSPQGVSGTVQCRVAEGPTYTFAFEADTLAIAEQAAENASATVSGDTKAWIKAFLPEPDRDRGALNVEGDAKLADAILDGLTRTAPLAQRAVHAA
jgi:HxlR-like helix-turn-helix